MKRILLSITIIVCKLAIYVCRLANWGGTTLPGRIACTMYPGILKELTRDYRLIFVTGTNGKTTTTRIIGQVLDENNISYITNKSGANLVGGVITTFIDAAGIFGNSKSRAAAKAPGNDKPLTALIEIDEAAIKVLTDHISPDILVVTNFFRDQLDRYGELYTTLRGVRAAISKSKDAILVLNADDSLCASLGRDVPNKVIYFGFNKDAASDTAEMVNSDAAYCIFCREKYEYTFRSYGHLGDFTCPGCGYHRPDPDITVQSITELTNNYTQLKIWDGEAAADAKINLPGLYNVYNALAAFALGHVLGLPREKCIEALASFECGFGRMEAIQADGRNLKLILVKNPTGFNQVLSYLLTEQNRNTIAFLINDNYADGTDISWLWDVDFEKLEALSDTTRTFWTSGIRAEDMAVRLKYAGITTGLISVEKDYDRLLNSMLKQSEEGENIYILPSYTAMLDIRKILRKKFKLKKFWE